MRKVEDNNNITNNMERQRFMRNINETNNDESEYNEQISEVVLWCKAHNLLLNAAKTKELIFDFRHCNISHVPLSLY